jgi:hypothetical protein
MSDWYVESRQNRQLQELRDELDGAASEARHLRSRLAQIQGSLEARVNKLAAAFDAFVELSDLRHELIGFADSAEIRQYAGQVLAALASDGEPPPAPPDVPGYWLLPAVAAVQGLCTGTDATTSLAAATARDERRTAIFVCLALAVLGRRGLVRPEWLQVAFGKAAPDGSVSRVQRTLWLTAARGGFGETGRETVAELLGPALAADDGPPGGGSWADVLASPRRSGQALVNDPRVDDQTAAADQLGRLRASVEGIVADRSVLEPAESTLRSDEVLESRTADADSDDGEDEPDPLVEVLRLVIAEGSARERDLLARVAVLRGQLSGGAAGAQSAEEPAGPVDDVLAVDLKGECGPHVAAFAVRLVAPAVVTGAERLCERASAEAPDQIVVQASGRQVQVGPEGPEPASLAGAEQQLRTAGHPVAGGGWRGGIAVAAIGLVGAVGLGLVHWFWILAGLVVAGLGARAAWRDRSRRVSEQASLEERVTALRTTAEASAGQLAAYGDGRPGRAAAATADLEAIRAALPAR